MWPAPLMPTLPGENYYCLSRLFPSAAHGRASLATCKLSVCAAAGKASQKGRNCTRWWASAAPNRAQAEQSPKKCFDIVVEVPKPWVKDCSARGGGRSLTSSRRSGPWRRGLWRRSRPGERLLSRCAFGPEQRGLRCRLLLLLLVRHRSTRRWLVASGRQLGPALVGQP